MRLLRSSVQGTTASPAEQTGESFTRLTTPLPIPGLILVGVTVIGIDSILILDDKSDRCPVHHAQVLRHAYPAYRQLVLTDMVIEKINIPC